MSENGKAMADSAAASKPAEAAVEAAKAKTITESTTNKKSKFAFLTPQTYLVSESIPFSSI